MIQYTMIMIYNVEGHTEILLTIGRINRSYFGGFRVKPSPT